MSKTKGSPHFTNPCRIGPQQVVESSFEEIVKTLCLIPEHYEDSNELRAWVRRNKTLKYVPSEVLKAFGFKVGAEV
jgi:hypothetical protein